jgi:hypothetical protein
MRPLLLSLLLLSAPALAAASSALEGPARPLVEIGDAPADDVTTRLKTALADAFMNSETLELSTGQKPGTIVVSFPQPVEAREHMGRTEYLFRVELKGVNGRLFERGSGNCWSDELKRCVSYVVRLANRFAPR